MRRAVLGGRDHLGDPLSTAGGLLDGPAAGQHGADLVADPVDDGVGLVASKPRVPRLRTSLYSRW